MPRNIPLRVCTKARLPSRLGPSNGIRNIDFRLSLTDAVVGQYIDDTA